jgi:hypothetical protein
MDTGLLINTEPHDFVVDGLGSIGIGGSRHIGALCLDTTNYYYIVILYSSRAYLRVCPYQHASEVDT